MAAVRAGDDGAFEQLYERYQRRISAYVVGMVHDHGRAEDVTQEVFISALRRLRATDAPIIFKPWVYEIAKNACIDAFRRAKRAEEVSYDADESGLDRSRLVSTSPTPDAAVDQRMTLQNLQGAFGGLSEAHHQILVMRELEGLTYRQIGERLGMTRPSVESTLFRARRRLTEEYDELVSGERCRRVQDIIEAATDRRLGVRDVRKMARHVSHCQPCRRAACLAGVDVERLAPRPVRTRIAALLPVPAFLRRRFGGSSEQSAAAVGHSTAFAQLSSAVASYSDPVMSGWVRAAAVAAGVAVAGLGAGVATRDARGGPAAHDAGATPAAQVATAGASVARSRTLNIRLDGARRTSTARTTGGATRTHGADGTSAPSTSGTQAPAADKGAGSATGPDAGAPAAGAVDAGSVAGGGGTTAPKTSLAVPGAGVPAVEVPVSVAAPSSAAVVAPAVVDDAVDAAKDAATVAAGTVGGVTNDAGNLLGGG